MENQTNKLPQHIIDITSSPEIFAAMEKIEKTLGLNIDQTGELYVLICEIITGKEKSSNFISRVITRLETSTELANKIAEETNKNIFIVVKNKLMEQNQLSENEAVVSSIEEIGKFNIEKTPAEKAVDVTQDDRSKILNSLENPSGNSNHNFSEPLVDHLLSNPTGHQEEKFTPAPPLTDAHKGEVPPNLPVSSTPEKKPEVRKGPDPYHEPIE